MAICAITIVNTWNDVHQAGDRLISAIEGNKSTPNSKIDKRLDEIDEKLGEIKTKVEQIKDEGIGKS
ncbi:hypothetical protein ZU64_002391 [Salmonella enterica subsp. diarizonae]|nr:hypothetical protein [Salmonella enterica subsp. diarizonae]